MWLPTESDLGISGTHKQNVFKTKGLTFISRPIPIRVSVNETTSHLTAQAKNTWTLITPSPSPLDILFITKWCQYFLVKNFHSIHFSLLLCQSLGHLCFSSGSLCYCHRRLPYLLPPFLAISNLIRLAVGVFFLKMQLIILLLLKGPLSWLFGASPLHHLAFASFSFFLTFPPSIHFLSAHLRLLCCCCSRMFYALSHLQAFCINYSIEYLPLGSLAASHPLPALHPQLTLWHG